MFWRALLTIVVVMTPLLLTCFANARAPASSRSRWQALTLQRNTQCYTRCNTPTRVLRLTTVVRVTPAVTLSVMIGKEVL